MGSALLNTETADSAFTPLATEPAAGAPELRAQVAERLAAHRSRRSAAQPHPAPAPPPKAPASRSARIAAAVAERYAHTPTYRAFLAAEAERAVQQARAAAEIAALNAQALAAAQQSLLDSFDQSVTDATAPPADPREISTTTPALAENLTCQSHPQPESQPRPESHSRIALDLWPDLDPATSHQEQSVILSEGRAGTAVDGPRGTAHSHNRPHRSATDHHASNLEPRTPNPPFTVRFYEDASSSAHVALSPRVPTPGHENRALARSDDEALALDDEIAFRQSPVFEEPAGPAMPLPANLIEFPRQLIASRKARPRLAEGPLRDEAAPDSDAGQLRIFEVDPAQISTTPAADADLAAPAAPQWSSIWLDTPAGAAPCPSLQANVDLPNAQADARPRALPLRHTYTGAATIGRRLFAVAVNAAIVIAGLAAVTATFATVAAHIDPMHPGALHPLLTRIAIRTGIQPMQLPAALAVAAVVLFLLYQALFFTFSTATPGMRCARIALCTFQDENPTRRTQRRRILALLLSASPFAFGFLWAALDEDRLAWHDRLTRTYQRKY